MGKFNFIKTDIPGVFVIETAAFGDDRGFFMESYNQKDFLEAGLSMKFIQDNHSKSIKGVLRGLHFQREHPQGKLVRVISGAAYDVGVDLRKGSPTYGKYFGMVLTAENKKQLYIPEGFAHGFLSLKEGTEFLYKVTDFWYKESEDGLLWNDKDININWPIKEYEMENVNINERDKNWQSFKELQSPFEYSKNDLQ